MASIWAERSRAKASYGVGMVLGLAQSSDDDAPVSREAARIMEPHEPRYRFVISLRRDSTPVEALPPWDTTPLLGSHTTPCRLSSRRRPPRPEPDSAQRTALDVTVSVVRSLSSFCDRVWNLPLTIRLRSPSNRRRTAPPAPARLRPHLAPVCPARRALLARRARSGLKPREARLMERSSAA